MSKRLFLDFIKMFESRLSAKELLRGALGSNFENHLVKRVNEIRFLKRTFDLSIGQLTWT